MTQLETQLGREDTWGKSGKIFYNFLMKIF